MNVEPFTGAGQGYGHTHMYTATKVKQQITYPTSHTHKRWRATPTYASQHTCAQEDRQYTLTEEKHQCRERREGGGESKEAEIERVDL